MNVSYTDEHSSLERTAEIQRLLPENPIIDIVHKKIEKLLYPTIVKAIKQELEIYRAYPKRMPEKPKEATKTFDTRNSRTCFMGKGFKSNDILVDSELTEYRNRVGTVNHPEWGNATLLEIWGADHFAKYPKMVKAIFSYGVGLRETMPGIKIHVNPLIHTSNSGKTKYTKEEIEDKKAFDLMVMRAQVFGVKSPKKRR